MNNKKLEYNESYHKSYDNIPFWKCLYNDENFNLIYREHNDGYSGSREIRFCI